MFGSTHDRGVRKAIGVQPVAQQSVFLSHYPAEEPAWMATDGSNQLCDTLRTDDTNILGRSSKSCSRSRPRLEAAFLDGAWCLTRQSFLAHMHTPLVAEEKKIKVLLSNCKIMSRPRKMWLFTLVAGRRLYKFICAWWCQWFHARGVSPGWLVLVLF